MAGAAVLAATTALAPTTALATAATTLLATTTALLAAATALLATAATLLATATALLATATTLLATAATLLAAAATLLTTALATGRAGNQAIQGSAEAMPNRLPEVLGSGNTAESNHHQQQERVLGEVFAGLLVPQALE